jgi:hypothetical protein
MSLPGDITTIILTGTYLDLYGSPRTGTVTFAPTTPILVDLDSETILAGEQTVALSSGAFSVTLPCTSGLIPAGWLWQVTENVGGAGQRSYAIALPSTLDPTVDISTLTPVFPVPPVNWALLPSQLGVPNGAAQLNSSGVLPVSEGGTGADAAAGALAALGAFPLPVGGSYPGGTTEYLRADGTWDAPPGGSGAVSSVFGRTGTVTAQSGDYTAAQVGADASGAAATAQANAETYAAEQAAVAATASTAFFLRVFAA